MLTVSRCTTFGISIVSPLSGFNSVFPYGLSWWKCGWLMNSISTLIWLNFSEFSLTATMPKQTVSQQWRLCSWLCTKYLPVCLYTRICWHSLWRYCSVLEGQIYSLRMNSEQFHTEMSEIPVGPIECSAAFSLSLSSILHDYTVTYVTASSLKVTTTTTTETTKHTH